jgi:putative membrane protein
MTNQENIIRKAEFSQNIKAYILTVGALLLFISVIGIPIFLIWFLGFGQYYSRRYYEGLKCDLTEKHLRFKKGVYFRVEKTIPLENIQDLTFIENPILNMLELKILKIETAGTSNPQGSDMKLIGIMDTANFKESVLDQRELLRQSSSISTPSSDGDQSIQLLTEIRDLLKHMVDKN